MEPNEKSSADENLIDELVCARESAFQSFVTALRLTLERSKHILSKTEKCGSSAHYSQNDEILRYARMSRDRSNELANINRIIKKIQRK